MSIIIQKYGGTSVGSIERIRNVADLVLAEKQKGSQVVVVASAMAGVTNTLVQNVSAFTDRIENAARDFVIANGENISCGLLALALQSIGVNALPLSGWQVPIVTTDAHGEAEIQSIDSDHLKRLLAKGITPVITGFQGVSLSGQITTLGRGGSDTSAVAIAAAMDADRCDIYTDIDGIYTADPRLVSEAELIPEVSYAFALQMAQQGAKVIHPRAVAYAQSNHVALRVLSSFGSTQFTQVSEAAMSGLCAVAHFDRCWATLVDVSPKVLELQQLFSGGGVEFVARDREVLLVAHGSEPYQKADSFLQAHRVFSRWSSGAKVSWLADEGDERTAAVERLLEADTVSAAYRWKVGGRVSTFVPLESLKLCANYVHRYVSDKKY